MVEHLKSKSTQPNSETTRITLYCIDITVSIYRELTRGAASPVICRVVDAGVAAVLPPGGVTGGRSGLDVAQVLRDVTEVLSIHGKGIPNLLLHLPLLCERPSHRTTNILKNCRLRCPANSTADSQD